MNDLARRIAELPPEKRALFERMLKEKGLQISPGQSAPATQTPASGDLASVRESVKEFFQRAGTDEGDPLSNRHNPLTSEIKGVTRKFYNAINEQLDTAIFGKESIFLNYGYVADGNPQYSRIELPKYYPNRNSLKLILEVIGDCDVSGSEILDVGCGRGGLVYTLYKYFHPRRITGVDLSSGAISFCSSNHDYGHTNFVEADAEKLPFAGNSFDFVTNVESSHNYPNLCNFYTEVFRVLRRGGYFLYADLLTLKLWSAAVEFLQRVGFAITRNQDITGNVLLSCDETARARVGAFHDTNAEDAEILEDFLAVPGSKPYDNMRNGISAYKILWLQKGHENRLMREQEHEYPKPA